MGSSKLRTRAGSLLALFLCLWAGPAAALTLRLDPSPNVIEVGDTLSVDLVLEDLSPNVIAAYQIGVSYDDGVLDFLDYTPSGVLGDPGVQTVFGTVPMTAEANVFEVSFLTGAQLDLLQGDTITLGTLEFEGIGEGEVELTIVQSDLSNPGGGTIMVDDLVGATVDVQSAIPEPTGALLFTVGGVLFAASRGRRRVRARA